MPAARQMLAADRWHFRHGPIDIVIGADGDAAAVVAAHEAAWRRFATVLDELVAELPLLRAPVADGDCPLRGAIARRMWSACVPFRAGFITPMAAVAGAVAEALIGCYRHAGVRRAWVNNGGDIALHLTPGESLRIGVYADLGRFDPAAAGALLVTDGTIAVDAASSVRGVATSGWRGRSHSLGIADSATILADTASRADAAATVVANAVDVDHPGIVRCPACELKDDSDLGSRLVTVDVPTLSTRQVHDALAAGRCRAAELRNDAAIEAAVLVCQGWAVTLDNATPRRLASAAEPARRLEAGSVLA